MPSITAGYIIVELYHKDNQKTMKFFTFLRKTSKRTKNREKFHIFHRTISDFSLAVRFSEPFAVTYSMSSMRTGRGRIMV